MKFPYLYSPRLNIYLNAWNVYAEKGCMILSEP